MSDLDIDVRGSLGVILIGGLGATACVLPPDLSPRRTSLRISMNVQSIGGNRRIDISVFSNVSR